MIRIERDDAAIRLLLQDDLGLAELPLKFGDPGVEMLDVLFEEHHAALERRILGKTGSLWGNRDPDRALIR